MTATDNAEALRRIASAANTVAERLWVAKKQCDDAYVDPYRVSPSLPVMTTLAEIVVALTEVVSDMLEESS